ncbi:hypothetical protein WMY93_026837 [Mugilogobius chulae]|uniref:RING-type domain-containing protein n=1 Tax=Mugilogobius chulae TaxID=88201 RepID=A0AAW0N8Y5_9GOBI
MNNAPRVMCEGKERKRAQRAVMARANSLCEEQFECPICTDVFKNPVSLPCGHNFCDGCIRRHWKGRERCKCPLCKREFNKSLQLNVNTLFRDIVDNCKQDYVVSDDEKPSSPEDVLCDCCLYTKRRAVKTCLVCLTSFCDKHLEPHRKVASLTSHALTDPVPKLQEKMCTRHHRILEKISCYQQKVGPFRQRLKVTFVHVKTEWKTQCDDVNRLQC